MYGRIFTCPKKYSKCLSWAKNLNKLFTVLGGEFKFSAQDRDLEYFFGEVNILPYLLTLKPTLVWIKVFGMICIFVQLLMQVKRKKDGKKTYWLMLEWHEIVKCSFLSSFLFLKLRALCSKLLSLDKSLSSTFIQSFSYARCNLHKGQ